MNLDELPLPADTKKYLSQKISDVANLVEKYDYLVPVIFLLNSEKKEELLLAVADAFGEKERDKFAVIAKKKAAELGADLSVFISESYTLEGDAALEYQRNSHKYPNGMKDHPDVVEIVAFVVESHTNHWLGLAKIVNTNDVRKMAPMNFRTQSNEVSGRFSNLLSKIKTQ